MRSDVQRFALTAPGSLQDVLARLAQEPQQHTLIAGGTELMVALNTGRLNATSLISLHRIDELRFIHEEDDVITMGAGTTFSDIRKSTSIALQLPLLAQAASWTGSIANQNRGTLGGNICNASPAADTPPALLVYGATLTLRSASGTRTVPYEDFHLGYKQTALRPDELLYSVSIPRTFSGYRQYIRKVGTRNAQAISKVALAAMAQIEDGRISVNRIAAACLADRPLRCVITEQVLNGAAISGEGTESLIRQARAALASEAMPIDDIRSTAKYRVAVAANLLEEFVRSLQ